MKKYTFKGNPFFSIVSLCIALIFLSTSCEEDSLGPESMNPEPVADTNDGYERLEWNEQVQTKGRTGGQIVDELAVVIGSTNSYEVDYVIPQGGFIVTGIGLRLDRDNVTTMRLERRFLNSNGSMGPRYISNHGRDPNHPLEVWYAVPNGYAIVGVGVRADESDCTTLHVHYMAIDQNARLFGPILTARRGTEPNYPVELNLIAAFEGAFDLNRTITTGFGFRVKGGNFTVIKQYAGELK